MSYCGQGSRPCPLRDCSCVHGSQNSLLGHLLIQHSDSLGLAHASRVEGGGCGIVCGSSYTAHEVVRFKDLFHNNFR